VASTWVGFVTGRPPIEPELIELIVRMSTENRSGADAGSRWSWRSSRFAWTTIPWRSTCFILSLERRRILHVNVTRHPYAAWAAQQIAEGFGEEARSGS
jgi:hypothetical protein